MIWRWIDEGGTFCPLIATVQDRGCGAVGATKFVAEISVMAGILTGCGEGLKRNWAAIRTTRRIIPMSMSQDTGSYKIFSMKFSTEPIF